MTIWGASLSCSPGTKTPPIPPTQGEDGAYLLTTSMQAPDWLEPEGWWLRFQKHRPVTSPPANQKKVVHPAALPSNVAFTRTSLGEFRSLEHKLPVLAWPSNKPFSAPNPGISACLDSLRIGHTISGRTTLGPLLADCTSDIDHLFFGSIITISCVLRALAR